MKNDDVEVQCLLNCNNTWTIAWVPKKAAIVNASYSFRSSTRIWNIVAVYSERIIETMNRNSPFFW